MSEYNDGGLAERGGGGLANPGGPNTAGGGGGQANRSGMGLGVNSGNGWVNNPYVNSATSGGLGATLAAYQQAQARARAKAKAAAAGVVTPTVTPPINPATGQPYASFRQQWTPQQYQDWAEGPNFTNYPGEVPDNIHAPNNIGGYQGSLNNFSGNLNSVVEGNAEGPGRQFGGPVAPGQQYTVGENGPETLQMGPGGGGQVIPHNPMDRLGGMNPQMMQQLFQMQRQFGGGQGPGGGPQQQPPVAQPPAPPTMPPTPQPQQGGPGNPGGGWQQRMGIEGLSRPRGPQPGGFGLSGLGQPGVMGQLRRQGGLAG